MTFRINIKSISGQTLKFTTVESYEVKDGFLIFKDSKNNKIKRFAVSNAEIEEEDTKQ
jgi:hypothetical protein|tara:strand:- start:2255 stop:2428 length:174 start_codon:yes stop_codon:yes gene_type:complete